MEDLNKLLRETLPTWRTDGLGLVGPQPAKVQPPTFQPATAHTPLESPPRHPSTVFPVEAVPDITEQTAGSTSVFPFQVRKKGDAVTIYPGTIETKVPTLFGTELSLDPVSLMPSGGGSFQIVLLVNVSLSTDDNYRYAVESVSVEYGASEEEFVMTWEDPDTKASGFFYIRVADITVAPAGAQPARVTKIRQRLFSSFRNLIFVRDDVLPIGVDMPAVSP